MKYLLFCLLICFIIIYLYSNFFIKVQLPKNLNKYTIFGPVFKNDGDTFHTQFREKIFYCVNSLGKVVKKGKYKYKLIDDTATIVFFRKKKKYKMQLISSGYKKNVYLIQKKTTSKGMNSKKKNILLVNTNKNLIVNSLNNKSIIYTVINSYNNSKYPKYSEFIHFYKDNFYNDLNITISPKKKYSYTVSNYENGYINDLDSNIITKLIFYQSNSGKFTNFSSVNKEILYEGKFKIIQK